MVGISNDSKVDSSRVEGNDFSVEGCRRKEACDIVANQVALYVVAVPSSMEVAQRKEFTQCNSGELVGTVVEETRCGVEASRPIAVDGKEGMMEVGALCPRSKDLSLKCVDHVSANGLCKSLSGSVDDFGPGINLEVALGPPNNELTVHGPSHLSSPDIQGNRACDKGPLINVGSIGSGTFRLKDQGHVLCPATIHNPNRSTKKAGKKKVQMEGFSRFARLYGHQSAAIGRFPSKSVVFRPAAVALAQSELSEDPVPSPENWQPDCWEYFLAVEVCIYEIYWFFKMGKIGYVGTDCCKTINVVSEKCSWKLFPSMSFMPEIVQSYCGQPRSQGGAPAPVGISPSVSEPTPEQEVLSLDNK
ncbi:hypothetical protein LOK49_LG13G00149 [Camellia lanceoleosa]|uniref:Uncharacterized protein n=1 Tax=Camellia lanceoleosa TaxID=1840588 RepID=A0ACC0FIS6_9ERIC|nr:hypothetical protein LOK49_LG13G00149 [Camellia lanceoleosa]